MIENGLHPLTEEQRMEGSSFIDFHAPLFIAWQLNSACNLDCLHCCEEAGHSMPDELSKREIKDFCNQIVKLRVPYVAISGGEPLLHPNFFEISEFLRGYQVSLKVETNGHLINREVASRFAELSFRSVQVSVDGAWTTGQTGLSRMGGGHNCSLLWSSYDAGKLLHSDSAGRSYTTFYISDPRTSPFYHIHPE